MQYVALLSGGKDSCFNLLHCARHGHKLVVAASLGPEPGKDEIDSYLYQTVGQDAIQLVADALEVPLMRKVIRGSAIEQGSEYGSRNSGEAKIPGDETEDLFELLSEVKTKFPKVQAVSVGAILSNYQRVRVENVCQRLSLIPLCYLWQRDQSELLSEMIETGLEAIIIKVAGIGLTTKHLGKTLSQMQPTLLNLNSLYGAHVCGEGGEYESLTLDSPLFKHRIVLEEVETVIQTDSAVATVAFLKVTRAHLEAKHGYFAFEPMVSEPPILSDANDSVSKAISGDRSVSVSSDSSAVPAYRYWNTVLTNESISKVGPWVAVSSVSSMLTAHVSIEDEVRECFETVRIRLAHHALDLPQLTNVTILLANMDLFPAINAAYASFFGTSPPARACVAVDLPSPIRVRLECIAYAESQPHERRSLHVQSLSYWAPANIGPYSQAIVVGERLFISGQIGLIPARNSLPAPQSLSIETALSLQHVQRVTDVAKITLAASSDCAIQGIISWIAYPNHIPAVKSGMSVSERFYPNAAPTLFAAVKALPKNALVETQVLLHTTRRVALEDEPMKMTPKYARGKLPGLETCWEISFFKDDDASLAIVACNNNDDEDAILEGLTGIAELHNIWRNAFCIRLLHTADAAPGLRRFLHRLCREDRLPCITSIPCRALATWAQDSCDYALCIIA